MALSVEWSPSPISSERASVTSFWNNSSNAIMVTKLGEWTIPKAETGNNHTSEDYDINLLNVPDTF
jgi:hypothetical protein